MKKVLTIALILFSSLSFAQEKAFNIYDVTADPFKQIENAKIQAQKENKNILIQAGGNWCKWCRMFNKFVTTDEQLDSAMNKSRFYT